MSGRRRFLTCAWALLLTSVPAPTQPCSEATPHTAERTRNRGFASLLLPILTAPPHLLQGAGGKNVLLSSRRERPRVPWSSSGWHTRAPSSSEAIS